MMNKKIYGLIGTLLLTSICGVLGMIQETTKGLFTIGNQGFKNFSTLQTLYGYENFFESMKKTPQKTSSGEIIYASKFKKPLLLVKDFNGFYSVYEGYDSNGNYKDKTIRFQIIDWRKQEITEFKAGYIDAEQAYISKGNHTLVCGRNSWSNYGCDVLATIDIYNLQNTEKKRVVLWPSKFKCDNVRLDYMSFLPGTDRYLLCCVFREAKFLKERDFITIDLEKIDKKFEVYSEEQGATAGVAWLPAEANDDAHPKILYETKTNVVAWCGKKVLQLMRYDPKDGHLTTLKSGEIPDTPQYTFVNGDLCLKPHTFYKEEESSEKNKKE